MPEKSGRQYFDSRLHDVAPESACGSSPCPRRDAGPDHAPMTMIAVGYQASPEVLDEDTRKKELAPRKRRPLAECFFEGDWSNPVRG